MKPLTERVVRFIDAYMGEAAGNGTEAALDVMGSSGRHQWTKV